MEGYTVKERREIYLKAAKFVFNYNLSMNSLGVDWSCACHALYMVSGESKSRLFEEYFPELFQFRPDNSGNNELWFGKSEGKEARIFALLLSAEMCDNPL